MEFIQIPKNAIGCSVNQLVMRNISYILIYLLPQKWIYKKDR